MGMLYAGPCGQFDGAELPDSIPASPGAGSCQGTKSGHSRSEPGGPGRGSEPAGSSPGACSCSHACKKSPPKACLMAVLCDSWLWLWLSEHLQIVPTGLLHQHCFGTGARSCSSRSPGTGSALSCTGPGSCASPGTSQCSRLSAQVRSFLW